MTSSLTSATSSMSNTALHIPTWYTISLYTYCSGGNWSTAALPDVTYPTYCSPPQPAYHFNPATVLGLDTSNLRGDEEYAEALQDYKASALWLFIAYVTALTASCVSAFLYLITICLPHDWRPYDYPVSKLVSMLAKAFMSIQVLFTVGAAATASALFYALADVVEEKLGHLGVVAVVGNKMLDYSSFAGLLSVCAAGTWAATGRWCPRKEEVVYWPAKEFPWDDIWVSWEELGFSVGKKGEIALNSGRNSGEIDVECGRPEAKRDYVQRWPDLEPNDAPIHGYRRKNSPSPTKEQWLISATQSPIDEQPIRRRSSVEQSQSSCPWRTRIVTKSRSPQANERRSRARTSSIHIRTSISEEQPLHLAQSHIQHQLDAGGHEPHGTRRRTSISQQQQHQHQDPHHKNHQYHPHQEQKLHSKKICQAEHIIRVVDKAERRNSEKCTERPPHSTIPIAEVEAEAEADRWVWEEEDIWIDEASRR